jgi:N-dimethylarginine dimethylaminohydrolase
MSQDAPPPTILMCPPDYYGIEYEINPWMNRQVSSDPAEARRQWDDLRSTLEALEARIELLEPVKGLPDLVFTANAGLVYGNRFVGSRFRYGERQGESPLFNAWFRKHGFEVIEPPEGANFEGAGDALFCGETLFGGYRFRSDARCLQWVGTTLGVEILPLELVDPRYYHLDTCFCPISPDTAIYFPGAFDDYGRKVLESRIPTLVEVSAEEAFTFTCNAVVVGKSIVLNEGTPKLTSELGRLGYDVRPHRLTEFIKAGGSAKCLTLYLTPPPWQTPGEKVATPRLSALH